MKMKLCVSLLGLLILTSVAWGDTSSGTVMGTSTNTATANPAVFASSFTGSGFDSVSGAFTATNMGTVTFTSVTTFMTSGTFVDTFSQGTLFGTFYGNGNAIAPGTATITYTTLFTGTGAFAGDTGESIIIGTSTATSPTMNSFTGTYTAFITTPEPSSLALMIAGMGLLPLIRKRLDRGRLAT